MKSSVVKHSVVIAGHKTSISLEEAFWNHLKEIAVTRQATLSKVIEQIDEARECGNLSSAIRVFVLEHFHTTAKNDVTSVQQQNRKRPPQRAGDSR
jgi:predicted DNA-binding ribbon-helix-helix protein